MCAFALQYFDLPIKEQVVELSVINYKNLKVCPNAADPFCVLITGTSGTGKSSFITYATYIKDIEYAQIYLIRLSTIQTKLLH